MHVWTSRESRKVTNMKKVLTIVPALLVTCAANAISTLTGPTGGFELPTANIAADGITVAVDQATDTDGIDFPNSRLLFSHGQALEIGGKYETVTQTDFFGSVPALIWAAPTHSACNT